MLQVLQTSNESPFTHHRVSLAIVSRRRGYQNAT
jgi:hypothetical protein